MYKTANSKLYANFFAICYTQAIDVMIILITKVRSAVNMSTEAVMVCPVTQPHPSPHHTLIRCMHGENDERSGWNSVYSNLRLVMLITPLIVASMLQCMHQSRTSIVLTAGIYRVEPGST